MSVHFKCISRYTTQVVFFNYPSKDVFPFFIFVDALFSHTLEVQLSHIHNYTSLVFSVMAWLLLICGLI